jgi:outer membrane protein assembly factor BamB
MVGGSPYRDRPPEEDRSILVVTLNGKVFGVDRQTGALRWKQATSQWGGGRGEVFLAMAHGLVIASSYEDVIVSLDYATGAIKWSARTQNPGRATILIERDVIICAKAGYLDCFSHGGKKLWTQPLTGFGEGRVALGFPGNVAQADAEGS